MHPYEEWKYCLALSKLPYWGVQTIKQIFLQLNSAKAVFEPTIEQHKLLSGLLNKAQIQSLRQSIDWEGVQRELDFYLKNDIEIIALYQDRYPAKLKECIDAPPFFFFKGSGDLKLKKSLAVVGTRHPSSYGQAMVEELVNALKGQDIQLVSGLAYGIDTLMHRFACENKIENYAVLAHGLDRIYPNSNRKLAENILPLGGWISEYPLNTLPERYHFPMRNRIIAGLADAIIIVETQRKGGAMITAKLGLSYNRELFAVPGRVRDSASEGCNFLIKTNMASLIQNIEDVLDALNWKHQPTNGIIQQQLFPTFSDTENQVMALLHPEEPKHFDQLYHLSKLPHSLLAANLLTLEMGGYIQSLPGNLYQLSKL